MEQRQPGFEEFTLLMLAITPHLNPHFFNQIIADIFPMAATFLNWRH